MPTSPKNKPRLLSAVFATVCIILVGDAIAPTASLGNSQYFWWLIMLLGFFIPYSLIFAELSAQYPSEGGIYTWVKKAFGAKWAGRVAWFYWVNYPLWIAALASLVTAYLLRLFNVELSWPLVLALQVFYIILVSILGCLRLSRHKFSTYFTTFAKLVFMLGLGGLGIYVCATQGTANPIYSSRDILPSASSLGFISLIIFNFLGFEIVSIFSSNLKNPKKEIPRAIILGCILITLFYLLSSFGINVATPVGEINPSTGLLDAYGTLLSSIGLSASAIKVLLFLVGGLFIYTLISNASAWSFGVNSITAFAAQDGTFPKSWTKRSRDGMPYIISLWTGIAATVVSVIGVLCAASVGADLTSLFWVFFLSSLVCLLLVYLPLFLAFYKLHRSGPTVKNAFWIEGGKFKIALCTFLPFTLLVVALFFALFPEFDLDVFEYHFPLFIGICIIIIIGEIMVNLCRYAPQPAQPPRTEPREQPHTTAMNKNY